MHAEDNYYDREEVKRMVPSEKEMFDTVTVSIEQCKGNLLHTVVPDQHSPVQVAVIDESGDSGAYIEEENITVPPESQKGGLPLSSPCALVRVLEDMESFMGIDGRIYTLSKGDILTLPERNAAVLSERNIVLNMNLCK
jgi:DNA replication factor GINS